MELLRKTADHVGCPESVRVLFLRRNIGSQQLQPAWHGLTKAAVLIESICPC